MNREPDQAVIDNIVSKIRPPVFDYLEDAMGDKTYLVGENFSIVDIANTCQFVQMLYSG